MPLYPDKFGDIRRQFRGGPVTIGGVAVGTVGSAVHTSGYTLQAGDDFDGPLSIIGPASPSAKYSTTKGSYATIPTGGLPSGSARSSTNLAMYDVDPLHTGYYDSNDGSPVPAWANSITQTGSILTAYARSVTAADQPHMIDPTKLAIGSMIHTGGWLLANAPCVIEARVQWNSILHAHMTWWFMSISGSNGYRSYDDIEIDFEGGTSSSNDGRILNFNENTWTNGGSTASASAGSTLPNNSWRTIAMRIDVNGNIDWFMDTDGSGSNMAAQRATYTGGQSAALAAAYYFLMTAHAIQGTWTSSDGAASLSMDWYRIWTLNGQHYVPQVAGQTYQLAFGAAASFTLPTTASVWGSAVTEVLAAMAQEDNEPGGDQFGNYALLPAGVTYNSSTNVLAIAASVTKPGRMLLNRVVRQTGASCQAQRVIVEIGPRIQSGLLNWMAGQNVSIDLYPLCDVGQILPKQITVSGLPSWLSLSGTVLSGTAPSGSSSGSFSIACTNSSGQSATVTRNFKVSVVTGLFVNDTMTGALNTALASHVGETGATWTVHPTSSAGDVLDGAGGLMRSNTTPSIYYASGSPASTDYYSEIVVDILSTPASGDSVQALCRLDTSAATYYTARYTHGTGVQIQKSVGGTLTTLTTYSATFAAGQEHTLRCAVAGSTTVTISAILDGTTLGSTTDSSITAAGMSGIRTYSVPAGTRSIGMHISQFTAAASSA